MPPTGRIRGLDGTDMRILSLLVDNARASFTELGHDVGLSANAVAQRVRRLETSGVIRGYQALIDPAVGGPGLSAVVLVQIAIDVDAPAIEAALTAIPAVVEVIDLAGSVDYELRLRCAGQDELYEAVQAVRALPGITAMQTRPVLREVLRRDPGRLVGS